MSCSEFVDLRSMATKRLTVDMLGKLLQNCTLSPEYVILVLDKFTASLLNNLELDFYELYKRNIYQIEDLDKKRKRYPMSDVIYFVHPAPESV